MKGVNVELYVIYVEVLFLCTRLGGRFGARRAGDRGRKCIRTRRRNVGAGPSKQVGLACQVYITRITCKSTIKVQARIDRVVFRTNTYI